MHENTIRDWNANKTRYDTINPFVKMKLRQDLLYGYNKLA